MKSNPVLRRRSFGHSIEPLEARIAPATLAILSGGNISVLGDQGGAGEIETLTFTVSGSDLHIADPTHAITAGAGFTQSGANEVFIALSSLTGNLTVNTGTGADALALSSNLSLPGDATFTSGGTLTFNNSLTLAANKNLTGSAGTISVNGAIGFGGGLQLTATGGGLDVAANLTKAAGGNATATLKATTDVRFTSGADLSVTSGALALTLNPDTDGNQAGGVLLDTGTTIDTNGGALTIGGGATPGTTPTGGVVVGPNPGIGVDLEGAAVSTGAGLIHIRALGTGSGHGVGIMSGSSLTTTTGAIDIVGTGGNGTGGVDGVRIALANSTVTSSGGDIAITGTANAADQGTGVMVGQQGSIRNTGTGGISLTGTGSATAANSLNNYGVFITRGSGVTINGGGNISILATAGVDSNAFGAGAGGLGIARLGFDGTNVFSGNISITVAEFGTTDSLGLGIVTVASTGGALTIQPLSPATTIGVGGGAGVLDVSAGDFGTLSDGFGSITIGRSNGTGAINVGPITFSDPVTLRNPGAGAGGIAFNGAVTANEGLVATSAGTVTVGATLTAGGASAIQLTGQDVTGSGDIATGGGLTVSNTGIGSTLSGVISGSAAPLTKLGAGTLTLAGANTYTGTTTINAGTLLVTGSLADGAAATDVTVAAGATLGGTGTIGGAVNNSGTVQPGGVAAAGTLTIAGGYTQVAGGTLAIELGGTAGAQFDHLSVGGTATLGGSLNATLINGFNPPFGSQFAVLTASPRTGTFSTVSGPVTAQYNPNNVTLVGPQLFTWDGSAADGNWFNAANWDLNAVPGAIDSAILGISSSINLTSDVQVGFFNQSTGTLTGSAALTVLSGLTWTGGTMSGSGVTHANGGLVLSGGDVILDTRTFDLPAGQTATLSGGANSLGFQNGAHFNNAGTFLVQNNGSFSGGGSAGTFSNTGTFTRNTATGTFAVGVPFDNTGTVNVQTGTVTFSVGSSLATTTGDFNVSSGAILRWSSNFNLGAASDVAGAGTVNFSSGTINVAGTYNLSGAGSASTFTGATVNFNATIASLGAGPLAISSGSVVSFNSNDLIVPSINLVSGTLGGTLASLTSSGLITWSGGTMSGSGVTHANGGLLLGGGDVILNTRTFDLPAGQTATLSGGANSLGLQNGAHFNNAGTFLVQNNASFSDNGGGAGTISNTGTFTRNTAAGVFTIGVPFDNTGTVNVQTGTLSFSAGSSLATTTGDFNVSSGATLRWSSSFNLGAASDVAGAGTVNFSSGTINVAGTYNLTGAGSASTFTGATVNFNATIASLGAGALAISSGSVVIFNSNDLTVPSINLASGTLGGTIASLSSSGLITWSGGRMSGSGVTHANGGLLLGGGDVILDTRTFDLPAGQTATLSGAGNSLGLQNGAHFNNAGTFLVQNNASFFDNGGSAGAFTNTGTFTRNTTAGVFAVGVPFDNTGTVNVQTGTLRFSAGSSLATTTGDFNVSSGAILRWSSNFNLGAASDVAGAGTVDFSSGTINVAGTYNLTGAGSASTFTGGTVNFNATIASLGAGALSISSGSVVSF
ncbi:MAG: hypothetical protein QOE70_4992, partial [Chthoniobacter sp.]|nr:hypothetical protein [Chthoniobacter sp.]